LPDVTPLKVLVVCGTTREGRFSGAVAEWAFGLLEARGDLDVRLLDLRDHLLPWFDGPAPARAVREYASDEVARLGAAIDEADAYVILTGEYNHGYPAVLKNALDWTFAEWRRKPVSFVGWGNVGGARAIEQLREVAVEFEMAPLRHAVHILPTHMMAIRESGIESPAFAELAPRLQILVDDLVWWASTLRAGRGAVS
jgi:NAD(P)H-dependent FMN reductase